MPLDATAHRVEDDIAHGFVSPRLLIEFSEPAELRLSDFVGHDSSPLPG
jgi:hypothetical protein